MPVSAGSGKHEPSQPRDRPQQQPKLPSEPPSAHPLSPPLSLPLSLPLLIYSRPAQPLPRHRFSTSRGDSSRSPHADVCRAPAGPMEEPQGNALVVRIGIPDLQQTVSSATAPNSLSLSFFLPSRSLSLVLYFQRVPMCTIVLFLFKFVSLRWSIVEFNLSSLERLLLTLKTEERLG